MVELEIVEHGLMTWGVLMPWSEIQRIVLTREQEVLINGQAVVSAAWRITFDLANGDFIEVAEGMPAWQSIVSRLPQHVDLRFPELDQGNVNVQSADIVLWSQKSSK